MLSKLTFLKIFLLSLLFTGVIFWLQMYLSLNFSDTIAEENYIEKSLYDTSDNHTHMLEAVNSEITSQQSDVEDSSTDDNLNAAENNIDIKQQILSKQEVKQIFFSYIPNAFRSDVKDYRDLTRNFINDDYFSDMIASLTVEFHKDMIDVRGKMKNKTIKVFDPLRMWESEFISLFVHEFSHYLDLYYFPKNPLGDTSDLFYNISWDSVKTMKRGQDIKDFVSGYAMTNKYEDFAESLTYFMFHNNDFRSKAAKSDVLLGKYNFFQKYLFENQMFIWTDFSPDIKVKSYYWDITKIEVDTQNFLQYLKKDI